MNEKPVECIQLSTHNISISYDKTEVVKHISFALEAGQIGCLLGPSGCGKSTFLRAIAGFEPVVAGEITMAGKLFSSPSFTLPPEQRQIGMVFQDLALFPHLSIEENIAFGLRSWSSKEKAYRVDQLLALVGLTHMKKRYPHSLSGGQQQRIALARALAPKPKLLLLDEPFSGLDAALRETLVPEVREILLQEKMSALLVTHDQMEAFAMADKVAVMQDGQIQQYDTPHTIYHEPKTRFVADFVGEGDFLGGLILDSHRVQSSLGILRTEKPHKFEPNQRVEILVRPDDLLHDDDSATKAKIISKQFRGSHFLYRVKLESQQELFCFASSHHNHAVGENIGIILDLNHLVMFA